MNKVRRETAVLHAGGPRRKANTEPWEPIQGGTTLRCSSIFCYARGSESCTQHHANHIFAIMWRTPTRSCHSGDMKDDDHTGASLARVSWFRFGSLPASPAGDDSKGAALERWIDEEQFLASFPNPVGGYWSWAWWRGG